MITDISKFNTQICNNWKNPNMDKHTNFCHTFSKNNCNIQMAAQKRLIHPISFSAHWPDVTFIAR